MADDQLAPSNLNDTERLLVWVLWRMGKSETNTGEIIRWYYKWCEAKIKADDIKECLAGPLSRYLLLFPSGRIKVQLGWKDRFDALGDAVDDSRGATRESGSTTTGITKQPKPKLQLLRWQQEALDAWNSNDRRGIVEAVTGTGKSYLGIGVLLQTFEEPKRVQPIVAVPTIALMYQWTEKLSQFLPARSVGHIGDGHQDSFAMPRIRVIVGVVNSLALGRARRLDTLLQNSLQGHARSLLIADECHRYVQAREFNRLLQFPFHSTLGLSATVGDYEVKGLGRVIFENTFKEAYRDGLVPHFDLMNVSTSLTASEHKEYLELSDQISGAFKHVMNVHTELERLDGDQLWNRMRKLMGRIGSGRAPAIERFFILCFKRAAITYTADNKLSLAEKLVRLMVVDGCRKVLVFFERIQSAEDVGKDLADKTARAFKGRFTESEGVRCFLYHSQMKKNDRERTLDQFRKSGPSALLACRSLDEGLDVPDVDGAILVASSQSLRQRIQRIGRVLRKNDESKEPIVVTLRVKGTNDYTITTEDKTTFDDVATIHSVEGDRCLAVVRDLAR